MSVGFQFFFVSVESEKAIYGSNDRELEERIIYTCGYEPHLFDEPGVYLEEAHRWRRALRGIIAGDATDDDLASEYRRVLQDYLEYRGVPSGVISPMHYAYPYALDDAMSAAGLPDAIRFRTIVFGEPPMQLPHTIEPCMGVWTAAEMRDALPAFRAFFIASSPVLLEGEAVWKELVEVLEDGVKAGVDAIGFHG